MNLHIFTAPWQPYTRFQLDGMTFRNNPRKVVRCHECRDWRWAKYLKVQAYYDYWRIECADGCYGENRNHGRK